MTTIQQISDILTRSEAAEYLKASVRTIDENIATGKLPAVRFGRCVRIRKSSLIAFVEANESKPLVKSRAAILAVR